MPRVDPSPSAETSAALMGNTTEPNARNMSRLVTRISSATIRGRSSRSALIESCVRAGVPATYMLRPCVSMSRNSLTASPAVFWSMRPAANSTTLPSACAPSRVNSLVKPGILLASSAMVCSLAASSLLSGLYSMTSLISSVRSVGKNLSKFCCAMRLSLFGGRYFSVMPPNWMLANGMTNARSKSTTGIAVLSGWRITHPARRPQKLSSTSFLVLVRRRNEKPHMSMRGPRMARIAASTVIEQMAARLTDAIAP